MEKGLGWSPPQREEIAVKVAIFVDLIVKV